jgi:hypothetical protein
MASIDISKLNTVSSKNVATFEFKNTDVQSSNITYFDDKTNEVKTKPDICSGYHITNYSPPSPSNFSYPEDKRTYRSKELYIVKPVHTIVDPKYTTTPYVGEVIIKHSPSFLSDPVIYLCFFLTNSYANKPPDSAPANDMDAMIKFITKGTEGHLTTSLSSVIPKQTSGVLCNNIEGEILIIFTNPIYIKSDLSMLTSTTGLFKINDVADKLLLTSNNIATALDNNIYMDCNPTGVSNETVQTYNVPIYSEYSKDASKFATMSMTMNFTSVVAAVFIVYAFFPSFYVNYVYENVKKVIVEGTAETKATRLDTIEIFYALFVFSFFIINIAIGFVYMSDGGWYNVLLAVGAAFIYILTNSIIGFTRMANKDEIPYNGPFSFMEPSDLAAGLMDFFRVLGKSKRGWAYWAPIIFITSFALLCIAATYNWTLPSIGDIKPATLSTFIILPFFLYLMFLISYAMAYSYISPEDKAAAIALAEKEAAEEKAAMINNAKKAKQEETGWMETLTGK